MIMIYWVHHQPPSSPANVVHPVLVNYTVFPAALDALWLQTQNPPQHFCIDIKMPLCFLQLCKWGFNFLTHDPSDLTTSACHSCVFIVIHNRIYTRAASISFGPKKKIIYIYIVILLIQHLRLDFVKLSWSWWSQTMCFECFVPHRLIWMCFCRSSECLSCGRQVKEDLISFSFIFVKGLY